MIKVKHTCDIFGNIEAYNIEVQNISDFTVATFFFPLPEVPCWLVIVVIVSNDLG